MLCWWCLAVPFWWLWAGAEIFVMARSRRNRWGGGGGFMGRIFLPQYKVYHKSNSRVCGLSLLVLTLDTFTFCFLNLWRESVNHQYTASAQQHFGINFRSLKHENSVKWYCGAAPSISTIYPFSALSLMISRILHVVCISFASVSSYLSPLKIRLSRMDV